MKLQISQRTQPLLAFLLLSLLPLLGSQQMVNGAASVAHSPFAIFYIANDAVGNTASQSVALGDLDNDGDLDAFVGNALCLYVDQGDLVWLNDGNGNLTSNGQELGTYTTFSVALGDIDGDNDLDALVAHHLISNGSRIWYNDGSGNFTEGSDRFRPFSSSYGAAVVDLDGQNGVDLLLLSEASLYIWFNNGNGTFDAENQDLIIPTDIDPFFGNIEGFAIGDVDKDSYLDIVTTGLTTAVWRQQAGTATFALYQSVSTPNGRNLALGDLNGDTYLDIFLTTGIYEFAPDRILLNDMTGQFELMPQEIDITKSRSVTLGDIDNDNDLDAIISRSGIEGALWGNTVWLNNGSAVFSRATDQVGNGISAQVALGDLDDDGDLDAYLANSGPFSGFSFVNQPDEVWFNARMGETSPFDQYLYLPAAWRGPQSGPILLQSFWRADNGYIREVPVSGDGTILWSLAAAWEGPLDITTLPGTGAIEAQDNLLLDTQLFQSYWRNGEGYVRYVPITNGRVNWAAAEPWQGPLDISDLPGTGAVQAQDNIATADTLYQSLWRDDEGWFREVPIVNGHVQWNNADAWELTAYSWQLPGTGSIQAQSNTINGDTLFQSIWRSNSNYVREIPIVNGAIQWGEAVEWFGPIQDSLYPGSGEIYSWDNVIIP